MTTTKHGKKRVMKRLGLKKSAADKQAERARTEGLKRDDITGSLRRYLDSRYHDHAKAHLVVYNNYIYVFQNKEGALITVLNLPSQYRKSAKTQQDEAGDSA